MFELRTSENSSDIVKVMKVAILLMKEGLLICLVCV